jgi:hypothetical protein
MVKTRYGEPIGSATAQSQLGVNFRVLGHNHCNMRILPIDKVRSSDRCVPEARESYWVAKYNSMKPLPVDTMEHGMIFFFISIFITPRYL